MMRTSGRLTASVALLALLAAGCGSNKNNSSSSDTAAATSSTKATEAAATTAAPDAPASSTPAVQGDITVFAAASLTAAFNAVGAAFTQANPQAKVTFSFDASSALAQQITQGAPADLFASADTANMDKLTKASLNGTDPVVFATNLLTIITPRGNPKGIATVDDLDNPDLKVVL